MLTELRVYSCDDCGRTTPRLLSSTDTTCSGALPFGWIVAHRTDRPGQALCIERRHLIPIVGGLWGYVRRRDIIAEYLQRLHLNAGGGAKSVLLHPQTLVSPRHRHSLRASNPSLFAFMVGVPCRMIFFRPLTASAIGAIARNHRGAPRGQTHAALLAPAPQWPRCHRKCWVHLFYPPPTSPGVFATKSGRGPAIHA